ncbi:two-component system activity regulator YycH [Shimazuella sp. AN120528]|uniref:two-component system activity regulator YycH n=1 Tax=Shimazuella soli TaxID=1892854 RepID=UPI001F1163E1|nr:two-component system activity regulator YycH [Shimazuella soli]MCH5585079.1 two-component system activity regulator YycH [Shimazuella soli]
MALINKIKTISLVILVISSVILTAVLWYSTPSYDEQNIAYIPAPYIAKDNYYVKKYLFQLTAPPFLISHTQGKNQLITQQQSTLFPKLIHNIHGMKLDGFEVITPTADDWNLLFHQTNGLEMSFLQDLPVEQLDAFFFQLLKNEPLFQSISTISRVWLFENPATKKSSIWFISDQDGKVIQANTDFDVDQWPKILEQVQQTPNLMSLEAVPTNGENPWDKANQNKPFSRILYMPNGSISIPQLTYSNQTIGIDSIKEWLFQGDNIEPIDLSKNESVFMNNNQILTFYKQQSYMVYVDNSKTDGTTSLGVGNEIDVINTKFMAKHHGWTGNYILDKMSQQDNAHLYTFRLISQALPVYWEGDTTKNPHLDTIQLQAGSSINAVSKYVRSLHYLSKKPTKQINFILPNKETILAELTKKQIPITSVNRIYPIYKAKNNSHGQVVMTPCWQMELSNGEKIQIGGVS